MFIGEAGKTHVFQQWDGRLGFSSIRAQWASPWRNPIERTDAQDIYIWVSHQCTALLGQSG